MTAALTLTLSDFLLDRYAEDETEARSGPYLPCDDQAHPGADIFHPGGCQPTTAHRRLLAEVEAKRRIMEEHAPVAEGEGEFYPASSVGSKRTADEDIPDERRACGCCGEWTEYAVLWPCLTLRALASVYADHPDYRAEWAL